jgi:hypothetical protein
MKMSTEQWWDDTDRGKQKYSEKKLSQCHVVHYTDLLVIEPQPPETRYPRQPVSVYVSVGTWLNLQL